MYQKYKGGILTLEYAFKLKGRETSRFRVEFDETTLSMVQPTPGPLPDWTRLGHHQCQNCPLDPSQHSHCPVAISLVGLVNEFKEGVSYEEAEITVQFQDRSYNKHTPLQYGVSSLMGLHMVTNGCPIMDKLRPMAFTHLPFASIKETLYRVMSMYLMAQFYIQVEGGTPDWALKNLADHYEEISIVNRAFHQRIAAVTGSSDAVNNALVNLDCFAILTTIPSAREHMQELKSYFTAWTAQAVPNKAQLPA